MTQPDDLQKEIMRGISMDLVSCLANDLFGVISDVTDWSPLPDGTLLLEHKSGRKFRVVVRPETDPTLKIVPCEEWP